MAFTLPCERRLRKTLGALDAAVECIELGLRMLQCELSESGNPNVRVGELAVAHGLVVNACDGVQLRAHACRLYITSVYHGFDEFLTDLKTEAPKGKEWKHEDGDDSLRRAAKNLNVAYDAQRASLEYRLCQYYRGLRNRFAHTAARREKDGEEQRKALGREVSGTTAYARLRAPNEYASVCFDDFVLYSRSVKAVARELSAAAQPDKQYLVDVVRAELDLGRLWNNPSRLRKAIPSFLRNRFSLDPDESAEVVEMVLSGPLAQR